MTALAKDRKTKEMGKPYASDLDFPVAASTLIYAGSLVMLDGGYLKPAATDTGVTIVGMATEHVDNSSGSNGDLRCMVRQGIFNWANSAAADEIATADVPATVYAVDDQTVAKTDGTGTRTAAGKVIKVDANGVWVLSKL